MASASCSEKDHSALDLKSGAGVEEPIYFYGHHPRERFAAFSNFYMSSFTVEDVKYSCMEQYIMVRKAELFGDKKRKALMMSADKPHKIKALGQKVRPFNDHVWLAARKEIAETGLRAKFSQNEKLKALLLSTGTGALYEAAARDKNWGIGYNAADAKGVDPSKYGYNLLGKSLMVIRQEIKELS